MSQISIFQNKNSKQALKTTTIDEFLNDVKIGKCRSLIEPIRAETDLDKIKGLKGRLPAVTISGAFLTRGEENLIEHSGFISIDFDNVAKEKIEPLKHDPYTYALALSASGNGYFAIVKIKTDKHKESFNWLQDYYFKEYGLILDPAPKNVASLRFYSYDPELVINQKAKIARVKVESKRKAINLKLAITEDNFGEYVKEVGDRGINITESYEDFRNISFGIASEYKEQGREYFHILASQSAKYEQNQADKQYNEALKDRKSGITIGTVYHLMKDAGIELKSSIDNKVIPFTKAALKRGETVDSVKQTLKEIHGLNESQAELAIKSEENLDFDEGNIKKFLESLEVYLTSRWSPRFNEVKLCFEVGGDEVTPYHYNYIAKETKKDVGSLKASDNLIKQYLFHKETPKYNPLLEWIENHRGIDRGSELKKLFDSYEVHSGDKIEKMWSDIFITRWLVGLIATINGKVVRSVLTFIGPSNCGKSEWFRRILPKDLREYQTSCKFNNGKDDEILMCKKLIILNDEAGGGFDDEAKFKDLASKDKFSIRLPYAETAQDYKRLAALCITSNPINVINDSEFNTRVLPVHIGSFKGFELLDSVDRDALFMELVDLYESGAPYELQYDELSYLKSINTKYEQVSLENDLVEMYCESSDRGGMNATEVLNGFADVFNGRSLNVRRVADALRRVYGNPVAVATDKGPRKGYKVRFNSYYQEQSYAKRSF